MSVTLVKTFPPSPLSESLSITQTALMASLSGNLDDYYITQSTGYITARAKESYQSRYRTSAGAEERLSVVENELRELKEKFASSETLLRRSQMYTLLLSIVQPQLFDSLPDHMQQTLRNAGLANLPQTFVIWWMAWNSCDPLTFPLPASISQYTLPPKLHTYSHQLFNRYGGESWKGVTVRQAWESLNPVARDLMVHCWCSKKSNDVFRNTLAHLDTTKEGAQELLIHDLRDDLQYLYGCAMNYVSNAPGIFTQGTVST